MNAPIDGFDALARVVDQLRDVAVAVSVALAGIIGFVGLLAPHAARAEAE